MAQKDQHYINVIQNYTHHTKFIQMTSKDQNDQKFLKIDPDVLI